jgi:ABC-2 type transport system permease protein
MLFKFITGGNLLGAFLIMERKRRVKDRIMMSGIGAGKYICGTSLVYLMGTFVGSFVYFLAALLLDFDFGMRSPWQYLVMVCLSNILSVGIFVFASSLTDDSQTLESMAHIVLMPMGIFSGVIFPFDYMPKALKIIGSCCPQRWISHGIERIQETGSFTSALTDVALILGLSVLLFVIGAYRNGKRTSH